MTEQEYLALSVAERCERLAFLEQMEAWAERCMYYRRLAALEQEQECIRGWVKHDWALELDGRPTAKAVVEMYRELADDSVESLKRAQEAEAKARAMEAELRFRRRSQERLAKIRAWAEKAAARFVPLERAVNEYLDSHGIPYDASESILMDARALGLLEDS